MQISILNLLYNMLTLINFADFQLTPQSYDPAASFTTDVTSTGNSLSITSTGVSGVENYSHRIV